MAFNPLQTQYGTHIEDNIRSGPLFEAAVQVPLTGPVVIGEIQNPVSYETIGLPGSYNSPIFSWSIVPAAATPDSLFTSQIVGAPGQISLRPNPPAASGVVPKFLVSGQQVWEFDTPRNVTFTGSAAAVSANATVQGFDEYGFAMTEIIATPVGNLITSGKKAFSAISSISLDAGTTAAISIGNGDVLGFPYFVTDTDSLISIKWAGAEWIDGNGVYAYVGAGLNLNTIVTPAGGPLATGSQPISVGLQAAGVGPLKFRVQSTATTGDVRGTIQLNSTVASNGARKLTVVMYVTGSDQVYLARNYTNPVTGEVSISEPQQTQELIGVPQYSAV